jgi:hypothetical protein
VDLGHERPVMTKGCAVFLLNRDRWFVRAGTPVGRSAGFRREEQRLRANSGTPEVPQPREGSTMQSARSGAYGGHSAREPVELGR